MKRIQCKEYDQQTPHHAQIYFFLQWNKEMIDFGDAINYRGIQAKVNKPLIFLIIS